MTDEQLRKIAERSGSYLRSKASMQADLCDLLEALTQRDAEIVRRKENHRVLVRRYRWRAEEIERLRTKCAARQHALTVIAEACEEHGVDWRGVEPDVLSFLAATSKCARRAIADDGNLIGEVVKAARELTAAIIRGYEDEIGLAQLTLSTTVETLDEVNNV